MEYEQKPSLPNPFIILSHLLSLGKYAWKKCSVCFVEEELETTLDDEGPRIIMGNEHRLKTFLSSAEQARIFDFEEDNLACMTQGSILSAIDPTLLKDYNMTEIGDRRPSGKEANTVAMNAKMIKEIYAELEGQREKLDKIISFWDRSLETASNADADDLLGRSRLNIDVQSQTVNDS